ncbi:DMT family transporter [Marinomonas sp. IMCC 4694]|uniref:aromatic amino acid exporter YddG n=1 Tax=Marinomonas sp. IMCC 4694 TaxID=2605432 RepID=UPI0011E78A7C|nr:EamA family transporter [Marinomonas sp. IMCC 4694]TYL47545.1 EamA family transporter [Marinomonas sp. IMCC 4694]
MSDNPPRATLIGSLAILLWSTLALFTTQANAVPPLLLLTLTFCVASVLFFVVYLVKGELKTSWQQTPKSAITMGGLGFYSYHLAYFYAFQHAPPVEAGLIAYLWPLIIVLMVGLTKGNMLSWTHLIGAIIAFVGTGIMLHSKDQTVIANDSAIHWTGYAAAFACALIWSSYSVANRRFQTVPSSAVLWYCLVTALLAGVSHVALEKQAEPLTLNTWIAILGLGLGPVGVAFFCWDLGVKKGNLSLLGVLSYTAPALSTTWLGLFTDAPLTTGQIIACLLITTGALFASLMPNKKIPLDITRTKGI